MLNRYSHVEPDSIDNVPAVPVREELDDVIHIEEVRKAVKQTKCNKSSGVTAFLLRCTNMEGQP